MSRIELILGCMFSGKTTELIRRISRYHSIGTPALCINHSNDTRTTEHNSVQTHEGQSIPAVKVSKLMSLVSSVDFEGAKVIGIDEAQFFEDLVEFVKYCEYAKKIVFICGLDGDYERKPIGHILECIPLCDSVVKLTAYDMIDKDGTPAVFTHLVSQENVPENHVLVGGADKYMAVSRKNYLALN